MFNVIARTKNALASKPVPELAKVVDTARMQEYEKLAASVGITITTSRQDKLKNIITVLDYPIYFLEEVVSYMDKKAAVESKAKSGWHWKPLRRKDMADNGFGNPASRDSSNKIKPASDYYHPHGSNGIYNLIVPAHALRKVKGIEDACEGEKEFQPKFFITDYSLAPRIPAPDPFLMVLIDNPNLDEGEGRFVIDFWDEPNFGLESMLKG